MPGRRRDHVTTREQGPGSGPSPDPVLRAALDLIGSGHFTNGSRHSASAVFDNLLHHDPFMALADFQAYLAAQDRVEAAYADQDGWSRMAILNVARCGFFSSDRSMRDYIERIWHTPPSF